VVDDYFVGAVDRAAVCGVCDAVVDCDSCWMLLDRLTVGKQQIGNSVNERHDVHNI
jgi:hypothetical protein